MLKVVINKLVNAKSEIPVLWFRQAKQFDNNGILQVLLKALFSFIKVREKRMVFCFGQTISKSCSQEG